MLPVTISLGLINFNAFANTLIGGLVSEQVPRAIEAAFRVYMLPQGLFSVAIATVLFPTLARFAARGDLDGLRDQTAGGVRFILLLLLPAAAATLVLAEPITRLLYERGEFDAESTDLVSTALIWFSLSLPLNGINLLLTRTFFSLQRPWATTALAGVNLVVNLAVSLALYEPFGIGGVVAGTVAGNVVLVGAQFMLLRSMLGGRLGARRMISAGARMLVAAAALAAVARGAWWVLDDLLGSGLGGQLVAVGGGLAAGAAMYAAIVLAFGIPEARRVTGLLRR
jgi:putative peptidoglycan lipid II flippase